MVGAALLAIAAARMSGLLLDRFGPRRIAPAFLGTNAALFVVEWVILGWQPPVAAVLLYLHSSVMGAIAISSYWSLLNERFDPHSAKPLMARVAGAATFGGLVGGVSAERVAALLPQGSLLPMLGVLGALSVLGARTVGHGGHDSARAVARRGGRHRSRGPFSPAAVVAKPGGRHRAGGDARSAGGLSPQSRSGGVFRTRSAPGALLRTVLRGDGAGCGGSAGRVRASRARASRSGRLGREPPGAGGSRGPVRIRPPTSVERHSASRARRGRSQFDIPRRLRAAVHAVGRSHQAFGQVADRRGLRLHRQGRGRAIDSADREPGAVASPRGRECRRGGRGGRRVPRRAPPASGIRQRARRRAPASERGPRADGRAVDDRLHGRRIDDRSRSGGGSARNGIAGHGKDDRGAGGPGRGRDHRIPFGRPPAHSCRAARASEGSDHHRPAGAAAGERWRRAPGRRGAREVRRARGRRNGVGAARSRDPRRDPAPVAARAEVVPLTRRAGRTVGGHRSRRLRDPAALRSRAAGAHGRTRRAYGSRSPKRWRLSSGRSAAAARRNS